jgi:hypothetical protein
MVNAVETAVLLVRALLLTRMGGRGTACVNWLVFPLREV